MSLMVIPYVFIGGGLGACLRFLLSFTFKQLNYKIWIATLLVNILGTLFYFISYKGVNAQSEALQYFFRFGLLGALTTFSTFSFEVAFAMKEGRVYEAAAIFLLNILAGVLIAIGMFR